MARVIMRMLFLGCLARIANVSPVHGSSVEALPFVLVHFWNTRKYSEIHHLTCCNGRFNQCNGNGVSEPTKEIPPPRVSAAKRAPISHLLTAATHLVSRLVSPKSPSKLSHMLRALKYWPSISVSSSLSHL